jgi:hypothetical protein
LFERDLARRSRRLFGSLPVKSGCAGYYASQLSRIVEKTAQDEEKRETALAFEQIEKES